MSSRFSPFRKSKGETASVEATALPGSPEDATPFSQPIIGDNVKDYGEAGFDADIGK